MNLLKKPPMGQKAPKHGKDPERLEAVAQMPCVICFEFNMRQNSPTEVHHCKSGRYGTLRAPDCMTIPLCHSHHNKLIKYEGDREKLGFHNNQRAWEILYGPDTDWLSWVKARLPDAL